MEKALLDTDTLSEVLKQRDPLVNQRAATYLSEHGEFAFSEFIWFEVQRGLLEKNALQQIEYFATFVAHCDVKSLDRETFGKAAELWSFARQMGQPYGDADILIAAAALVHHLTLATGNTKHYDWIAGLKLDNWRAP
jgi:tRNA(fMet)-specific endonuclease VapC